jgi:predicted Rossmann-fold nucleotide-binding protein
VSFDLLVEAGMIAGSDLELFHFVDTPQEALQLLQRLLGSEERPETPSLAKSKTPENSRGRR